MLPIMAKLRTILTSECQQLGISAFTGKRVKEDNVSAIKEHHLFCNHSSGLVDFFI